MAPWIFGEGAKDATVEPQQLRAQASTVTKITCPGYQAYIFIFKMQNGLPTHCSNIHKRSHFPQQDTVRHKQTFLPPKHPLPSGQTKPNFFLHAWAASPTSQQLWITEQDLQTRACLFSCEHEGKLRLVEMTSIQRKPRAAFTKLQDAAHTYPSGGTMHSHQQTFPILYATSFCLQVIRNQNTHWPLSHRGQAAVITSTSSAGTGLCAAFLCVPCVGEAQGYNSGLSFTTQDTQEMWASSCHSWAEFLPLGCLAFPDLKRKFFLGTANSCLGKGERKHETVPSPVAASQRSPVSLSLLTPQGFL